jgi:hypothetical protein
VPERGLAFDDGTVVGPSARPNLIPLPPPAESTAEEAAEAAGLREFNELLIHLLLRWVQRARDHQLARRTAGLPTINVSWENAIVDQYAARLGRDGAEIALALLALSRPAARAPCGDAERRPR